LGLGLVRPRINTHPFPFRLLLLQGVFNRRARDERSGIIGLVQGLLVLDPKNRYTASKALASPFFSRELDPEGEGDDVDDDDGGGGAGEGKREAAKQPTTGGRSP
jgi:serine/threonine protein kinase